MFPTKFFENIPIMCRNYEFPFQICLKYCQAPQTQMVTFLASWLTTNLSFKVQHPLSTSSICLQLYSLSLIKNPFMSPSTVLPNFIFLAVIVGFEKTELMALPLCYTGNVINVTKGHCHNRCVQKCCWHKNVMTCVNKPICCHIKPAIISMPLSVCQKKSHHPLIKILSQSMNNNRNENNCNNNGSGII